MVDQVFTTTDCGGNLHAQSGVIQSPNHPARYPSNTECVWEINVTPGYHVDLQFVAPFELEIQEPCTGDFVEVRSYVSLTHGSFNRSSTLANFRTSALRSVVIRLKNQNPGSKVFPFATNTCVFGEKRPIAFVSP